MDNQTPGQDFPLEAIPSEIAPSEVTEAPIQQETVEAPIQLGTVEASIMRLTDVVPVLAYDAIGLKAWETLKNSECKIDQSFFKTNEEKETKRKEEVQKFNEKIKKVNDTIFGDSRKLKPVIINDKSNFVVVTYWWGDKVLNKNYARPCPSLYEEFLKLPLTMLDNPIIWNTLKNKTDYELRQEQIIPILLADIQTGDNDFTFKILPTNDTVVTNITPNTFTPELYLESLIPYSDVPVLDSSMLGGGNGNEVPVTTVPIVADEDFDELAEQLNTNAAAASAAAAAANIGTIPQAAINTQEPEMQGAQLNPTDNENPIVLTSTEQGSILQKDNKEKPKELTLKISYLGYMLAHNKIFENLYVKKIVNVYKNGIREFYKNKNISVAKIVINLMHLMRAIIEVNKDTFIKIINIKRCMETYNELNININNIKAKLNIATKEKLSLEKFIQQLEEGIATTQSENYKYKLQKDLEKAKIDLESAILKLQEATKNNDKLEIDDEKVKINNRIHTALKLYLEKVKQDLNSAYKNQYKIVEKVFKPAAFANFSANVLEAAKKGGIRGYLELILQYKNPITFDTMIKEWEIYCAKANCNYMAVEYKAFEGAEGYQLAINAKPNFIKKALEACHPKSILYIDGDMEIKAYPAIFDIPDFDYMARGWNMDPRGSDKFTWGDYSVSPYRFETSGGTMYFNQTLEAKRLVDLWIHETELASMRGKADDRIISLLFNIKGLMAPLRILQLPVEYLYLDQWYDDYLSEDEENIGRIFISHPQCLTSEDTAAGSGASNSREPESYKRVLSEYYFTAEPFYESVVFDENKYANGLRGWLSFIKNIKYTKEQLKNLNILRLNNRSLFETEPWGSYGNRTKQFQINTQWYEYPILNKVLKQSLEMQPISYENMIVAEQMRVIPKIVHQIWFGATDIPKYKEAMMKSVQDAAKCAGWTYKLWTKDDYTEKNFPNVWPYCKRAEEASKKYGQSRWAQIADLCRYELMCRFGGVYLDTNFFASTRIFETVEEMNIGNKQVIICNEDPCGLQCHGKAGKYISNSFIASVRHHLVFQHLISEDKLDSINIDKERTFEEEIANIVINQTTGPYYLRSGFDILENEFGEIGILKTETVYPIPMSKSTLRDPVENRCLVDITNPILTDPKIKFVNVDETRALITNMWEQYYPGALIVYMFGLGGSWDYSKIEKEIKAKWGIKDEEPARENIVEAAKELSEAAAAAVLRDAEHPLTVETVQ